MTGLYYIWYNNFKVIWDWLLNRCGLVMPYGDKHKVHNAPGNGLVSDGTKPLPEPMLTYH